jgi:pimeloyl-ACP methyl ester carboxylesterase
MHGRFVSSEIHYAIGTVEALRKHYRLVMIDTRGHGKSDKPHEPESYRMDLLVRDIIGVLDDLGIVKAHYFGYSMGGRTGFGMAKYTPERLTSLIIGGYAGKDPDPAHPDEFHQRMVQRLRLGRETWVSDVHAMIRADMQTAQKPSLVEAFAPLILQSQFDPQAFIAQMTWEQEEYLGLADALPRLSLPCLLLVGEADGQFEGARASSRLIPDARFVSFPELRHIETMMRLDLLLPPILTFLSEVDGHRRT